MKREGLLEEHNTSYLSISCLLPHLAVLSSLFFLSFLPPRLCSVFACALTLLKLFLPQISKKRKKSQLYPLRISSITLHVATCHSQACCPFWVSFRKKHCSFTPLQMSGIRLQPLRKTLPLASEKAASCPHGCAQWQILVVDMYDHPNVNRYQLILDVLQGICSLIRSLS